MRNIFFGPCPTGDQSFDIPLLIPQATEVGGGFPGPATMNEYFTDPPINVAAGAWTVQFFVTWHAWDGSPHGQPIYDACTFEAAITDGRSIFASGGYFFPYANLPTNDDTPGYPTSPFSGSGVLTLDMGCPNCPDLAAVSLRVWAASTVFSGNYVSFTVTAHGTWLG